VPDAGRISGRIKAYKRRHSQNLDGHEIPTGMISRLNNSHQPVPLLSGLAALGLFLLSTATLAYEINLTRLFSVAQFYHFAFMIVSIALLGFGASGTVLALFSRLRADRAYSSLSWLALGCGVSMLSAYLLTNWLPFDSFSVAWDKRQMAILVLHYVALACPFFFSGLATGLLLTVHADQAGLTYALNLLGSAFGCLLALFAPNLFGGEGTVTLSVALAGTVGVIWLVRGQAASADRLQISGNRRKTKWLYAITRGFIFWALLIVLLVISISDVSLRLTQNSGLSLMALSLSPYKGLSYALQYPSARLIHQAWNAFSRVDVIRSPGVRSLPGLSYRFLHLPPPQDAVLVDGDDPSPVVWEGADLSFSAYMPTALAYQLRPQAATLVLEPRGGLDILIALNEGARQVTAVEVNPLIVSASQHIYTLPGAQLVDATARSYLRRSLQDYDVIVFSLTSAYHPVRSGAYSLAEEYRYTVESFQDALENLRPGGILVVTRWLQTPPSEFLRAFAIGITALERAGLDPSQTVVALRGYNTGTLYMKNGAFTASELQLAREFAASRAFDLAYAPGIQAQEANRFNILPEDSYYQSFNALISAPDRQKFYRDYSFDVSPSSDDHPFFGHYFKWSQSRQVLAEIGKTWQPFGGAGYFVILALLVLAAILAGGLILLPAGVAWLRGDPGERVSALGAGTITPLGYFGLVGLAFLLVEIPLIQIFILYLGQPAYAVTTVLFSLLFFSGLGSRFSQGIPASLALFLLVVAVLGFPLLVKQVFESTLGLSLAARLGLSTLLLAPIGFLMGVPFPAGIAHLAAAGRATIVPWSWGVNGAASVVSAVLAALLALSLGFGWVLRLGAACYAGAWLMDRLWARGYSRQSRSR